MTSDSFHLSSASPCRDSGIPIPGIPFDIEMDGRNALSPDIGADEFTAGAVSESRPLPQPCRFELRGNPTNRGYVMIAGGPVAGNQMDVTVIDVAGRIVLERRVPDPGPR